MSRRTHAPAGCRVSRGPSRARQDAKRREVQKPRRLSCAGPSRARQDAKRREIMDAKQLTE